MEKDKSAPSGCGAAEVSEGLRAAMEGRQLTGRGQGIRCQLYTAAQSTAGKNKSFGYSRVTGVTKPSGLSVSTEQST